jgi:S1-C subfamily serine protease
MHLHRCLIILLSLLFVADFAYAQFTASQIASKYSSSVITIVTLDKNDNPLSFGSGFFINRNGDIVTNHHVLEGSSKAIIKTKKGSEGYVLEIIKDDPELDLLIAKTSLKNTTPVPLGNSDAITIGEDIVAIGTPAGLEGTISKGIISGIREWKGKQIIQITAPISPGSSGGPVFNLSGKVIGITTAHLKIGQNLNFAMPSNYLNSIKAVRIKLGLLPKKESKERVAETEKGTWKFYYEGEMKLYYDKKSILRKGKFVRVWIKEIPVDREKNNIWYEYKLFQLKIDCAERKWALEKTITYGPNGEVIRGATVEEDTENRHSLLWYWYDILPSSKDEELYEAVCE